MVDTPAIPIPSLTGNPGLDSIIGSVLIGGSAALTSMLLTWLNSKGFATTDVSFLGVTISPAVMVGTAVLTALTGAATVAWRYLKGTQVGHALAEARLVGVQAGAAAVVAVGPHVAAAVTTHADADAVVAQFAPPKTTDYLNSAELTRVRTAG